MHEHRSESLIAYNWQSIDWRNVVNRFRLRSNIEKMKTSTGIASSFFHWWLSAQIWLILKFSRPHSGVLVSSDLVIETPACNLYWRFLLYLASGPWVADFLGIQLTLSQMFCRGWILVNYFLIYEQPASNPFTCPAYPGTCCL
jgi:hypothetical protein